MPTVQILHRISSAVLFECDVPAELSSGLHVRHALERAAGLGAYLRGAYLRGADLRGGRHGKQLC